MECLVTGAAGFIGSHLCERLLREGNRVVGIDCLTPYYSPDVKRANLAPLHEYRWFDYRPLDLAEDDLASALANIDWVFHLAGTPGLVHSWSGFAEYDRNNILATHRLLEAVRGTEIDRFMYASTSSVYGRYASGDEQLPTRPCSPYGVTKLAGEQLCQVYGDEFDVPAVRLRFFSVYGPRQRPDMGYHRFINAVLAGKSVTVFGDGQQTRGNTYVSDCIDAVIRATGSEPGEVYNIGGGELVSVLDVLKKIQRITGVRAKVVQQPPRPGDQRHTGADVTKLSNRFGWQPAVGIDEGLALQIAWQSESTRRAAA